MYSRNQLVHIKESLTSLASEYVFFSVFELIEQSWQLKYSSRKRKTIMVLYKSIKKLETIYNKVSDPSKYDKRLRPNAKIKPAAVNVR